MPKRKTTLLDDLSLLPWWLCLLLAPLGYAAVRYGVPRIPTSNPTLLAMLPGLARLGWAPALLFTMAGVLSAVRAVSSRRLLDRQLGIDSIRRLSWHDFERLVGEAYRRQGYAVEENLSGGPDDGVDLVLRRDGETTLVQCKHWKSKKVGVPIVRELLGAMTAESAQRGIVICTDNFTEPAVAFARANRIELVPGSTLARLVAGVQPERSRDRTGGAVDAFQPENCPRCGSDMVSRTASRGQHAGKRFLGCSRYPTCRGIRTLT